MLRLAVVDAASQVDTYQAAVRRSPRFQLVAVEDSPPESVVAGKHLEALQKQAASFDACVLHTTADACLRAVDRLGALGKHILLDCPYLDLATLDQLVATCGTGRLSVVQRPRFTAYATTIRQSLREGRLGAPGLVRIHRWTSPPPENATRQTLWKMLVEEVDLTCWLLESSPQQVFGQSADDDSLRGGCQVHLGFAGSMAMVDCALIPGPTYYSVSVLGADGAAYADDHHNTNLVFKGPLVGKTVPHDQEWLVRQLDWFAEVVQAAREDTSVVDTRRAICVAHAAIESAASHRVSAAVGETYVLQ